MKPHGRLGSHSAGLLKDIRPYKDPDANKSYDRRLRANIGEDDLTHLEIACSNTLGYLIDPAEVRKVLTNNHRARLIHHHTLDEVNSCQLLEAEGIYVLKVECHPPYRIFLDKQLL